MLLFFISSQDKFVKDVYEFEKDWLRKAWVRGLKVHQRTGVRWGEKGRPLLD